MSRVGSVMAVSVSNSAMPCWWGRLHAVRAHTPLSLAARTLANASYSTRSSGATGLYVTWKSKSARQPPRDLYLAYNCSFTLALPVIPETEATPH